MRVPLFILLAPAVLAAWLSPGVSDAHHDARAAIAAPERRVPEVRIERLRAQFTAWPNRADSSRRTPIPPSVAAKRAQRAFGGKILGVELHGTTYFVKLRGGGSVRIVRVNAITGQVHGN